MARSSASISARTSAMSAQFLRLLTSCLLGIDDRAANGAGAREPVFQLLALAPADGALQGGEVLVEAAQHLQHRLAVVEEDVAPHDRVGGGDAREVAESGRRELDDLALG